MRTFVPVPEPVEQKGRQTRQACIDDPLKPSPQEKVCIAKKIDQGRLMIENIPVRNTSFLHDERYIPVRFRVAGQRIIIGYIRQAHDDGGRQQ